MEQNQSAVLGELRLIIIHLHNQLKTHRPCSDLLSTSILTDPITRGQLFVSAPGKMDTVFFTQGKKELNVTFAEFKRMVTL